MMRMAGFAAGLLGRVRSRRYVPTFLLGRSKLWLAYLAAIGICIAVGYASYASIQGLAEESAWVSHTQEVIATLHGISASTGEAELAARGYSLSGSDAAIGAYREAASAARAELAQLRSLTEDSAVQRERGAQLAVLLARHQEILDAFVTMPGRGDLTGSLRALDQRSLGIRDAIRVSVDEMSASEGALLAERQARTRRAHWTTAYIVTTGSGISIAIILTALLLFQGDFAGAKRAEQVLREANETLEAGVQARTAELQRMHAQLADSYEDLARFVEQAPIAIAMFDRDMRYIVASQRWIDDYAKGRTPLAGLSHYEIIPDLTDEWKACIARGLAGELSKGEHDMWQRSDGSVRWVRWALAPWRNETGIAGITIVAEDVTELKRRDLELQESRKELDALSAHLVKVREEERQRIAREIHDELGALLTGIQTHVGLTIDRMEQKGLPTGQLSEALALVDQATESVRRVATELRPSVLDQLGVWAAIEWHGRQMQRTAKLPCAVKIGEGVIEHPLEPEQRIGLFRIVQEALTNIVRHARAHAAWIRARVSDGALVVEIEDDGVGIDDRRERAREAWGIVGMQERARHFDWTLSVRKAPVRGTIVQVRIPLEVHHAG